MERYKKVTRWLLWLFAVIGTVDYVTIFYFWYIARLPEPFFRLAVWLPGMSMFVLLEGMICYFAKRAKMKKISIAFGIIFILHTIPLVAYLVSFFI